MKREVKDASNPNLYAVRTELRIDMMETVGVNDREYIKGAGGTESLMCASSGAWENSLASDW